MTPYELGILLHYYACADDHPECNRACDDGILAGETFKKFLDLGLLRYLHENERTRSIYEGTERLSAYIEAIRAVPLPVQKWVMP